jgi:hypothetical protein
MKLTAEAILPGNAADQAAYLLPCTNQCDPDSPPCGAQPGEQCVDYDRQGRPCPKLWAHPVRIADACKRSQAEGS